MSDVMRSIASAEKALDRVTAVTGAVLLEDHWVLSLRKRVDENRAERGEYSKEYAESLGRLGRALLEINRFDEAKECLWQAKSVGEDFLLGTMTMKILEHDLVEVDRRFLLREEQESSADRR
jgi:hypothetical protein